VPTRRSVIDLPPEALLPALGRVVRSARTSTGATLRQLAEASGLSERFLSDLEAGKANVSVLRLAEVARATGRTTSSLLAAAEDDVGASADRSAVGGRGRLVALLGLRGAGKSTIGARTARALGVEFIELDERIAARAGMSVGEMLDLHGPSYYRRLERAELERLVAEDRRAIVATAGNIVGDHGTFELLLRSATTIWLRASAEDHYARVVAQGDTRPMANRKNAMRELRGLLRARRALYERADHAVDTTRLGLEGATLRVSSIAERALNRVGLAGPGSRFGPSRAHI
jgi:XRE family aerobic/anaerobic benzoate catabolism transcriptional regulator